MCLSIFQCCIKQYDSHENSPSYLQRVSKQTNNNLNLKLITLDIAIKKYIAPKLPK